MISGLKGSLVYEDLIQLPVDGLRYELAEGELHVTPAPSPRHQWASKQLQRQLESYFEGRRLGRVFDAPIDVILAPGDAFQPDLVVVTDETLITARAIEGAPTLVVEILSESTVAYDRLTKSRRYAALGVPHFWIVDITNTTLECYRNGEGAYTPVARVSDNTPFEHPDFPGLVITTAPLWDLP
jgi:Uma2 family endonuclease